MGNCASTTHRFFRLTRHRLVRKDSPMRVDEAVEAGEETRNNTGHEGVGGSDYEVDIITDIDADSECSSTLGEFPSLENLCEGDEELEQIKNSIEPENTSEKAVQKKVEDEIEIERREYEYEHEYEDSECSSSLREFLMLERLCEEYEEAKQRTRERRDQEKLEGNLRGFEVTS
ncbi:unnamed protein product [Rodentolepis nana]|uniref:Uncharacterized protein n=1 Tax=Rodentolepis nana TaxID=102285 RepID=A0A0R3T7P4_RODNA|nr:unnamed protein product [Rodentolepis nana]